MSRVSFCWTDDCERIPEKKLSRSGHPYRYCAECWRLPKVRAEFNRGRYEDKTWADICVSCGAATDGASVRCSGCKAYQKRLRVDRIAAGVCARCLNPTRPLAQSSTGRTLKVCAPCLDKARVTRQQWIAKKLAPTD